MFLGASKAISLPLSPAPIGLKSAEKIRENKNIFKRASSIGVLSLGASIALFFVPTPQCIWCETNNFDVRAGYLLGAKDIEFASSMSHMLTLAVVPMVAFGALLAMAKYPTHAALNTLVLLDSALLTLALSQAIKISARREIPEPYFNNPYDNNRFKNQSFLSGHTSLAFSLLSTASVLAFREEVSWAPYFAAGAATAALLVGYSRIASGKHWASDVIAGMGLGIVVGVGMPYLIFF